MGKTMLTTQIDGTLSIIHIGIENIYLPKVYSLMI
ncbi:hypothetical protein DJ39_2950 [Yersinia ruckeri ATCC 29473]|nr:hypothetical protein DJ39_2950 [Yersinia ruckeri ATCC 29473]